MESKGLYVWELGVSSEGRLYMAMMHPEKGSQQQGQRTAGVAGGVLERQLRRPAAEVTWREIQEREIPELSVL